MYKKYKLKKDLPDLKADAIFEHRPYDTKYPDRGNPGRGCIILAWIDGSCQQSWCGETYIFPGQLSSNKEWFEPLEPTQKELLLQEIEMLKQKIEKCC